MKDYRKIDIALLKNMLDKIPKVLGKTKGV